MSMLSGHKVIELRCVSTTWPVTLRSDILSIEKWTHNVHTLIRIATHLPITLIRVPMRQWWIPRVYVE